MMQKNGLPYVLLRYFNVAGSDPEQEIGEVHCPETHIIPILLLKALEDAPQPVQIFGDQHPTPDGTCVRDYVHVMDLARVHLRALDYLENGGASRAFNVGLGKGTSIAELIEICRRVTGRKIPCRYEESNPGDPPILVADPGDTWSQLQLEPQYPNVEDMVRHSWDWLRDKRAPWLAGNEARNPANRPLFLEGRVI
jgi:UDP-glucose 4-epimerase